MTGRGAEARPPQEPLGLGHAEGARVDGQRRGEPERRRRRRCRRPGWRRDRLGRRNRSDGMRGAPLVLVLLLLLAMALAGVVLVASGLMRRPLGMPLSPHRA